MRQLPGKNASESRYSMQVHLPQALPDLVKIDRAIVSQLPRDIGERELAVRSLKKICRKPGLKLKTPALPGSDVSVGVGMGQSRDHDTEADHQIRFSHATHRLHEFRVFGADGPAKNERPPARIW